MIDPAEFNSSFSKKLPFMQLALDSTSIGAYKTCPKYYQYSIIEGWQSKELSPHLTFGLLLHAAREGYEKAKVAGLSHDDAIDQVLDFLLKATWDRDLGRPWISQHNLKNRKTLIQTAIWYLDAKAKDDPLETVILSNGKPAVELSFRFDTGIKVGGEAIIACGHLDRLAKLNEHVYVPDIKTSSSEVNAKWLSQFSPHNQFSLYTVAGKVAFGFDVEGVIVDGIQVGVGFARFQRHLVGRDESTLSEYMGTFADVVEEMTRSAERQHWRMNDKACDMYGGCAFRQVCAKSPASREPLLKLQFAKRVWDPLQIRGDI